MWQLGTWDDKSSWWYQKLGMGPNAGIFMNTKLVAAHGCSSCVQKVPSVVIDPYPKHVPRGQTSGHDFVSDDTSSGINHALPVINACHQCMSAIQAKKWNLQVVDNSRHQPDLGLGLPIYSCPEAPWIGPRCFDRSLMEWAWPTATLGKLAMPMWVSINKIEPPRLAPSKTKKALPLRFLIVDRIRVTAFGRFCVSIYRIYTYIHI